MASRGSGDDDDDDDDGKRRKLDPMDVGTDKGFTFTSPNWPQEPRQPISVLGPKSPDHPASSFYYAGITELPKIASLKLIKVQEYKLLDSSPTPAALRNHQSPESELDVVSVRVKDNDVVYESVKTVSVHLPVHGKTSTSRHQLIDADKGGMNPILVTKDDPASGSILGLSSGDHPDRKKPAVDVANNKIDDDDYESNYVEDGFGTLSTDSNSSNSVDYLSGVNTDSKTALDLLELYAKKKRLNMKRKLRRCKEIPFSGSFKALRGIRMDLVATMQQNMRNWRDCQDKKCDSARQTRRSTVSGSRGTYFDSEFTGQAVELTPPERSMSSIAEALEQFSQFSYHEIPSSSSAHSRSLLGSAM
ncbi:unnamed protein product [Notodromas monacha]|uniref:Spondin domain-containing protein n=1 Tax=Notodromas monacha TaxID=399045 RepID=A0A7R9GEH6_9CRUS|nr:unnamed protein product [Notodromas monacha]CAG0917873.1 unnamed protein product [Notodromas monacha]